LQIIWVYSRKKTYTISIKKEFGFCHYGRENLYVFKLALILFTAAFGRAQNTNFSGDSLSFSAVAKQVINNYPAIIKAQKDVDAAQANVNLAKTAIILT